MSTQKFIGNAQFFFNLGVCFVPARDAIRRYTCDYSYLRFITGNLIALKKI